MRVVFKTGSIPTRAAKRLKGLLGLKESQARRWTAEVLGYSTWHELEKSLGVGDVSALDEEISVPQLQERRGFQAKVLARLLKEGQIGVDPTVLLDDWQPSAATPQVPIQAKGAPEATLRSETPHGVWLGELLLGLVQSPDWPLDEAVADTLVQAVATTRDQRIITMARNIASSRIEAATPQVKVQCRRLLEATAARGDHHAIFNLFIALSTGDGGPPDPKRATDLLERLVNDESTPAKMAAVARGHLGASILKGIGRKVDPLRALALLEEAANAGNCEAAFNAGLQHDAVRVRGSRSGNAAKAAHFYRLAANGGHVPAACNLGLLLLAHLDLAEGLLEAEKWLEFASSRGDKGAQQALVQLSRMADKTLRDLDAGLIPDEQVREVQNMMIDMAMGRPVRRR